MIDVIIAGAGPNGLMLAAELALAGIRPVVLERRAAPGKEPRANGLIGQVVRLLDRRGLHARLTGDDTPPRPQPAFTFGAFPLDLTVLADNPHYALGVPQARLEAVLAGWVAELGVDVRYGHEVTGLRQDGDGAEVCLADGTILTCRFLVGADGGRSAVRRLAGIGFPGVTHDRSVSRTATVSVPASLVDPATGGLDIPGYGLLRPFLHTRTPHGLIVWGPFPGRPALLSTTEWPETPPPADDSPMSLAELRASAARVLGADLPLAAAADEPAAVADGEGAGSGLRRRLTGGNTRIADRYRAGRVLLLGDAAHVHPAIGGPGLNLGLQDAVNLGWKLAATVHGRAPQGLLDTYESERRPVAARVVMSTRAQSALIAPGDDVTGLRDLFAELLTHPEVTGHVAALMSGADVRYPAGDPGDVWAGRTAPDVVVHGAGGPVRLAELTRTARPLLLDATGTFAAAAAPWRDRVDVVTGRLEGVTVAALLIRPDCFVAWSAGDVTGLRAALSRYVGEGDVAAPAGAGRS